MGINSKTNRNVMYPYQLWRLLRQCWQINPALAVLGITMIPTLGGTLVGLVVDHRVISGAPAWLKPTKFAISVSIYAFTLEWFLHYVQGKPRLVKGISMVTALSLLGEMVMIVLQAMRGTMSHFNAATPLDTNLFTAMKVLIIPPWLASLLAVMLILRQRIDNPAFAWSLRLALILAFLGMAIGFLMTLQRSPEQQEMLADGHSPATLGSHSVGVNDGGPGLPIVGWSTVGGDLRVPHFFGLHALQIMPLLGWLITKGAGRIGAAKPFQVALVWIAGLGYGGGLALLTHRALRGQPIIAADRKMGFGLGFVLGTLAGITGIGIGMARMLGSRNLLSRYKKESV